MERVEVPPTISLPGGVEIELLTRDGRFLGLGRVTVGNTLLRDRRRPMFAEIATPTGVRLRDHRPTAVSRTESGGVTLDFAMHREAGGPMEWMLRSVRPRLNTADWSLPSTPATGVRLRLELNPVSRRIGATPFVGFRYRYRYEGEDLPIYKILDRGTWEIGGAAAGNEIWMRNGNAPPIFLVDALERHYSTERYLAANDNPNVFQFLPLQTALQGFTFTAHDAGVLVTWASEVAHVRTLIEKPRGDDAIVHWHEHCGDLDAALATAPVEVLWAAGGRDRVSRFNLYEAVRDHVWTALHAAIGMRQERVTTYGVIEEWGDADLDRYADRGVPKLLAAGARTIFLTNHFANNMNLWGVGNMCCTVDLRVPATVGPAKLARLCAVAAARGARVEMWGNTALSTLAPMLANRNGRPKRIVFPARDGTAIAALDEASAPWVRTPSDAIEADHYTPVFAVMNLRDPTVRAYWLERWRAARVELGLGGIFLDSSFNLSSDKFHWLANTRGGNAVGAAEAAGGVRPAEEPPSAILSQYRAHLDLMVEMQRDGYVYCAEDLGLFGVSRTGPDALFRLDSLPLWVDCLADFDPAALAAGGADPDAVFFRGLAYRMMWKLYWDVDGDRLSFRGEGARGADDEPTAHHVALFGVYDRVEPLLLRREILPAEAGVVYRAGDRRVLWSFADASVPVGATARVTDLLADEATTTDVIAAARHRVYLIDPPGRAPRALAATSA